MLEANGQVYRDLSGNVMKSDTILKNGGMNTVRSRLWVVDGNADYGLLYNLNLAKRVKAEGLSFYLDVHFSNTWADPGHQAIPPGWPTTLDPLCTQVYSYIKNVTSSFVAQGTPLDVISLGNEIRNGLLWPVGTTSSFFNIASLLNASYYGVKDGQPSMPKVMIHIDNGAEASTQTNFYDKLFAAGPFKSSYLDIQGVSFYPFYGTEATLSNLKSSLNNMVSKYGKDIVVAETDWPIVCSGVALSEPTIPISPQGQLLWVKDILSVVNSLPNGHGKGLVYWEPAWIGNAGLGSKCASNLLFYNNGTAVSSVNMYL